MDVRIRYVRSKEGLAYVDGVRIRVDRNTRRVRWRCDDCGAQINQPTCPHTVLLAQTPVPPGVTR